jgi:hypothetical protein
MGDGRPVADKGASHAITPPTAVIATMSKKIGLGRTDWRSGRMLTF